MAEKMIRIERTTDRGYESEEHNVEDCLRILNTELENKRTIFIDGRPFLGEFVQESDVSKCKNEISVTNQLIGG